MILAIETATTTCSIALTSEHQVLGEHSYYLDKSHSALLPSIVEELMVNCGVEKKDLTAVAVSDGPGSYTGLRIGTSAAKGFCYALELPLIAVPTLKSLAYSVSCDLYKDFLLCPMLDARRMEVYTAFYDVELEELRPVEAIPLERESFSEYQSKQLLLFGNGAEKTKPLFEGLPYIQYLDKTELRAGSIGLLAQKMHQDGQIADLAYYEPNYFKAFKAVKPKSLI
ncbi:MAG: tRNA (adenosine(37)-N6)-threonylcarbamoyltransferase complex dimerization subunit type 1 TsaB [Bacteroidota bacterium]